MLSNEWWEYHLTENGWAEGSYKLDTANKEVEAPTGTLLTRRYYENLSHKFEQSKWFEDTYGDRKKFKELLIKFPYPKSQFKLFRPFP